MGFIYKISNNFNNKLYIGLTTKTDARSRWYQHRYLSKNLKNSDKSYLHRSMHEHGIDNFTFEVIEEIDNDLLPEREQYWINYYNSYIPNGYNLTLGGEGTPGFSRPQSEEEKNQKRKAMKKFMSEHPERRELSRQQMVKNNNNPEYRQKALDGYQQFLKNNPGYFSGENNPFYGKHHTEENLKKIRERAEKAKLAIQQLDKDTEEVIATYAGVRDAEAALQVSHGWISKAAKQGKIAYGYKWKFVESVTTNSSPETSTGQSGEPNE